MFLCWGGKEDFAETALLKINFHTCTYTHAKSKQLLTEINNTTETRAAIQMKLGGATQPRIKEVTHT